MSTLSDAFRSQARATVSLGSPFMGRLMTLFADRLRPDSGLTERMFNWPGDVSAMGASVPLRLAGALHGLVLDGTAPELAQVYPPNEIPDDDRLWQVVRTALDTYAERLDHWLDSAPQTNEVRRSAVLIAAAHWLTAETGLPLRLSELGASAGLNLMFDRFALELGGQRFGATDPALTLTPDWTGPLPPPARLAVRERRGTDLSPLDPKDPTAQLRLTAYLWPDQPDRLERTRAAIAVAEAAVDQMDAADWLETRLTRADPGSCHMLYHTVAWQYFPASVQARCRALIEAAGARASAQAPLAWFGMEADATPRGAGLVLRLWPGNRQIDLGRVDFHGRWVDWSPKESTIPV